MARTVAEIKKEMTDVFIADETIINVYGVDPARSFEDQFSRVSIESILFYIVAACAWTLEFLFGRHVTECSDLIRELKPHSRRWYATKAKMFQYGRSLIADTDTYDNEGLTDEQIENEQVVKHSAVVEKAAIVYVKVAGGDDNERHPLTDNQLLALKSYFNEIKDAGVKLEIVNKPADEFQLVMDVYYNPQLLDNSLERLDGSGKAVYDAIKNFVENLDFNGEYQNSALIEQLLQVDGVVLVELKEAYCNGVAIDAKITPDSGYFKVNELGLNAIAYETISD